MAEYYVGELLDDLAAQIVMSADRGAGLRTLKVNPYLYDVVAEAKERELSRGNPLLLLGMELVRAEGVAPARAEIS